jgi:hypothetical protein
MSPSVLGHLTLGYQLVWNRLRQIAAVQLFIGSPGEAPVDAEHLLRALKQTWSLQSPALILSVQSPALLIDLLAHAVSTGPAIAVQSSMLADPAIAQRVPGAHRRPVPLFWRGQHAERESLYAPMDFQPGMVSLTPGEVLQGARAALHPDRAQQAAASPVLPGQIYEGVPNRALVEHCLDQRGAWGVAGWPAEDVLQAIHHRMPPDRRSVNGLLAATDADASLEVLENLLAEEPVLAYRFLRFANSEDFKLREGIDSTRQRMMVLGLSRFRSWLVEQSAGATEDVNLLPVRRAMVVRARLMEHLLDAGDAERLRHEVVLCGLLSNIDMVVGEPMPQALQSLPLSERVLEALVSRSGPYAPYLELAAALEYPGMSAVPALCEAQELDIAVVNREVLRVLSQSQRYPARAR